MTQQLPQVNEGAPSPDNMLGASADDGSGMIKEEQQNVAASNEEAEGGEINI